MTNDSSPIAQAQATLTDALAVLDQRPASAQGGSFTQQRAALLAAQAVLSQPTPPDRPTALETVAAVTAALEVVDHELAELDARIKEQKRLALVSTLQAERRALAATVTAVEQAVLPDIYG
ncbi:MAG TPA: hypothetical protein VKQ30_18805 [Ktedonobacterales bacterium]|nr:hypothetical protein [Ktedonobacterales bacterium]